MSANSASCYKVITNVCETGHICTANAKYILGELLFLQVYRRLCKPVKNINRNSVTDVRKSGAGRFPPTFCHLSNSATSLHYLQILLSMFHYFPRGPELWRATANWRNWQAPSRLRRNMNCLIWKHERNNSGNSLTRSVRGVEGKVEVEQEKIGAKKQCKRKIGTKRESK